MWEQTGTKPDELQEAELPSEAAHVWGWFIQLTRRRAAGAFTPNPISYQEIAAWSRMTGNDPDPFEVECLVALDDVWLANLSKE